MFAWPRQRRAIASASRPPRPGPASSGGRRSRDDCRPNRRRRSKRGQGSTSFARSPRAIVGRRRSLGARQDRPTRPRCPDDTADCRAPHRVRLFARDAFDGDDGPSRRLPGHQHGLGPPAARRLRRTLRRRRRRRREAGARRGHGLAAAPAVDRPRRLPRGVESLAAERLETGDEDLLAAPVLQPSQIRDHPMSRVSGGARSTCSFLIFLRKNPREVRTRRMAPTGDVANGRTPPRVVAGGTPAIDINRPLRRGGEPCSGEGIRRASRGDLSATIRVETKLPHLGKRRNRRFHRARSPRQS